MFEKEKLSQLKNIQVDPEKKLEDFDKIRDRLSSKPFHWQIPAVIIAIACISLFLVGTFSPKQQLTSDNKDSSALQAVYYVQWEGDPESTLQAGVKKVKNEETLKRMNSVLQHFIEIDKDLENSYVYQSYQLKFEDSQVIRLQEYREGEVTFYRDFDKGQVYELKETSFQEIIELQEPAGQNIQFIIGLLFVILLSIVSNKVKKKLRDPDDPKRQMPMHSTSWQSAVEILSFLMMVLIISIPQLHLFQLIAFLLLTALINILLEVKYGKNKWRMVQFVLGKVSIAVFMYVILWTQPAF